MKSYFNKPKIFLFFYVKLLKLTNIRKMNVSKLNGISHKIYNNSKKIIDINLNNRNNNINYLPSPKFHQKDNFSNNYESNFSVFSFKDAVPCLGNSEFYFKKLFNSENELILKLLSYLEYIEIINLKNVCKQNFQKIDKKLIKDYIELSGLTDFTRISFWYHNLSIKRIQEETIKQLFEYNINELNYAKNNISPLNSNYLYNKILKLAKEEITSNKGNFMIIADEIGRDLNRTFHSGSFIDGEGQTKLGNILISIAYVRPEVNYCQGMNFVAGALLEFFKEEMAFWIFLILLDDYELNALYSKVFFLKI